MAFKVKAIINPKNRVNKSGYYTIFIRIIINRKTRYINTGFQATLDEWQGKDNAWLRVNEDLINRCASQRKALSPSEKYEFLKQELNAEIKKCKNEIENIVLERKLRGLSTDVREITKFYKSFKGSTSFNDYAEKFVSNRANFNKLNTIKKYNTFITYINEFRPGTNFSDLNEFMFQAFADWLLKEKKLRSSSAKKYFDPFKRITKDAVKNGLLKTDPFKYVEVKFPEQEPLKKVFLSVDEVNKIRLASIPEHRTDLLDVRDKFLLLCWSGMYYTDLVMLPWEWVVNTKDGYIISGKRRKNNNAYISPLYHFKYATEIIEKQKGINETLVFPECIPEPTFNKKLKEIANLAGIDKALSSRKGRDSFGQYWMAKGYPEAFVQKMMGQVDRRSIKNYYEIEYKDISDKISQNK